MPIIITDHMANVKKKSAPVHDVLIGIVIFCEERWTR
jgi:hypothetical protein